ncbi:ABC transporter permease [Roseomonas sp. CCTCC AB2023176]|uniref:ABC transporter permease n=1 Tax=Roseomonas sp. CCTCC AB2023176 TaxID=3342640 RepID=UPI0035D99CD8
MRHRLVAAWSVIAAGLAGPALAQPMLYEQRLPEGTGFVRLVNATAGQITVKPDYDEATTLGTSGAERVSPFYVSEGIAGRPVRLQVTAGGRTVPVEVRLQGSALNIVVIRGSGERMSADAFQVRQLYEQQRAVLAFVNAVPDCPNGTVALANGQAVIQGVGAMTAQNRAVAPAAAVVRASCGTQSAPNLDLGRLQAGGLYSVWLMAPEGQPISFVARDTIARR